VFVRQRALLPASARFFFSPPADDVLHYAVRIPVLNHA
jgi:hypothetical protein